MTKQATVDDKTRSDENEWFLCKIGGKKMIIHRNYIVLMWSEAVSSKNCFGEDLNHHCNLAIIDKIRKLEESW